MPRTGKIADGLRQEFARLVKKHGETDLLPLYLENGVYNFYLKEDAGAAELAPLSSSSSSSSSSRRRSSSHRRRETAGRLKGRKPEGRYRRGRER